MKLLYLLPLIFLTACGSENKGDEESCSAYITWEAPVFRGDGTRITIDELEKFTIYVNTTIPRTEEDETLLLILDVTDTSERGYTIPNLGRGQRYFYMTVTDKDGNASGISNVLSKNCK
jgi:hypothetical protein